MIFVGKLIDFTIKLITVSDSSSEVKSQLLSFESTYNAKHSRASIFRRAISVELPNNAECVMTGPTFYAPGKFELENQNFSFDWETLFRGGAALVTYNYSSGLMGVGEYLALSDMQEEFILALRPASGKGLLITRDGETVGKITFTTFGQRFTANTILDLPSEYVLLCLWFAMTRMVG